MSCKYCSHGGTSHDAACPESMPNDLDRLKKWSLGYDEGRAGKAKSSGNATYQLGYLQGEKALEEAGNGFNPSTEGRQW